MSRQQALFWTVVGHPVFMNTLGVWLLFNLFPELSYGLNPILQWFYMVFIVVSTGVIPLLFVLFSVYVRKSADIMMPNKEDRNQSYLIVSAIYLVDFYLSKKTGAPWLISAYLLSCSTIMVTVLIVNLFNKISIHGSGLGALTGVVFEASTHSNTDLRWLLALLFCFSGIVLTSRLFLEAHNSKQIYGGFLTGLLLMILML